VSFTFGCALIFVYTYAHTLFLEVNSIFQYAKQNLTKKKKGKEKYAMQRTLHALGYEYA
jgi:hypothetical protein